jgi:co-chaperonin GroES (HSP10)
MKAINYYVVVDKIKEKPKTIAGLELTENQNDDIRYLKGKVVSVGDLAVGINEGDTVYYDKFAGHGVQWKTKYYYVIKHGDIVLVE